jgi:hypothetical protein
MATTCPVCKRNPKQQNGCTLCHGTGFVDDGPPKPEISTEPPPVAPAPPPSDTASPWRIFH